MSEAIKERILDLIKTAKDNYGAERVTVGQVLTANKLQA